MRYFAQEMPRSSYQLSSLSDADFNALQEAEKLRVADKLLTTLFFSYPFTTLQQKIDSGTFVSDVYKQLQQQKNDITSIEAEIVDPQKFDRPGGHEEVIDILSRFYVTQQLDKYFFNNWVAYILTQTIMFSPAYELDSSHAPDVARVYNRLVTFLDDETSMGFITYVHMSSEDNWRRFRSPEDNGREMLEIFALDTKDSDVPIAAKALQNWKLDRDSDTLVVGLNENTQPLKLFGTTLYNGDDFYRELVKSKQFEQGVVTRLVDFFFPQKSSLEKEALIQSIVKSNPQTWQGILKQIVFSQEYLLHNERAKSAEELFFSLAKKIDFQTNYYTIYRFKTALENMHQATMKYKLGKLKRVPLDTLSFANYSKFIRHELLMRYSEVKYANDYKVWSHQGWSDRFLSSDNFAIVEEDAIATLHNFIHYLFKLVLTREALPKELAMFDSLMVEKVDKQEKIVSYFNILDERVNDKGEKNGDRYKRYIAYTVLDYISRVEDLYLFKKVH